MKTKLPGTAETEGHSAGEPLSSSRLVGFSDGVFAVVITLLVLNIQVPSETISLHTLVSRQFPSYVIFIVTFAMVGIKWLNHHRLFALIRRVDITLNILNLLLLLGICAVPFIAAMIAKYMTTSDAALRVDDLRDGLDDQWLPLHGDSFLRQKKGIHRIETRHAEDGDFIRNRSFRLSGCDRGFVLEYLCGHSALSRDRVAVYPAAAAAGISAGLELIS
jgi:Endosomal/lysosomal potassium channel TMEM175